MENIDGALGVVAQSRQEMDEVIPSKKLFKQSTQNQNDLFEWVKKGRYFVARSKGGFVTSNFFGGHDIFPISSNVCLFNKEQLLGGLLKGDEEFLGNCQDEVLVNVINRGIAGSVPHGSMKDEKRRFEIYAKEKNPLQFIKSNQPVVSACLERKTGCEAR